MMPMDERPGGTTLANKFSPFPPATTSAPPGLALLKWLALLCVLPLVLSTSAFAQDVNDFLKLFGGMMQQAMRQAAQSEWRRLPPSELSCLDQALREHGVNVDALIDRGVVPSDPRLADLRSNCRGQVAEGRPQPGTAEPSPYVVDGLALGGQVRFESEAYKQYECAPSDLFPGYTWCHKQETEKTRRGEVTSSNSILHSQDGTALYVNHYIEPAFFGPNDVQSEIDRLSAKFGERPREFRVPRREGLPDAIIAVWGNIKLEQLDAADASLVAASGKSRQGLLVSFLGGLQRSAKAGVPVYRLAGGAGFLWAATFNQDGRGVLRFLTIDASRIALPIVAQANTSLNSSTAEPCSAIHSREPFVLNGKAYIVSAETFSISDNVREKLKSSYGETAQLADWIELKQALTTENAISRFVQAIGLPLQADVAGLPHACGNLLVRNGNETRLGDFFLFIARHDGRVPTNWAVLDSIGNHFLDLGRWNFSSQALVAIPSNPKAIETAREEAARPGEEQARKAEETVRPRADAPGEREKTPGDLFSKHAMQGGLFISPTPLTSTLCALLTLIVAGAIYGAFHLLRGHKLEKKAGLSTPERFCSGWPE